MITQSRPRRHRRVRRAARCRVAQLAQPPRGDVRRVRRGVRERLRAPSRRSFRRRRGDRRPRAGRFLGCAWRARADGVSRWNARVCVRRSAARSRPGGADRRHLGARHGAGPQRYRRSRHAPGPLDAAHRRASLRARRRRRRGTGRDAGRQTRHQLKSTGKGRTMSRDLDVGIPVDAVVASAARSVSRTRPRRSCCLRMEAEAAGSAHATSSWPRSCGVAASGRCCSTCRRPTKKIPSISRCLRAGSSPRRTG